MSTKVITNLISIELRCGFLIPGGHCDTVLDCSDCSSCTGTSVGTVTSCLFGCDHYGCSFWTARASSGTEKSVEAVVRGLGKNTERRNTNWASIGM